MKKEITYEELQAAASYVQARLPYTPKVALVLGSGLGCMDMSGQTNMAYFV